MAWTYYMERYTSSYVVSKVVVSRITFHYLVAWSRSISHHFHSHTQKEEKKKKCSFVCSFAFFVFVRILNVSTYSSAAARSNIHAKYPGKKKPTVEKSTGIVNERFCVFFTLYGTIGAHMDFMCAKRFNYENMYAISSIETNVYCCQTTTGDTLTTSCRLPQMPNSFHSCVHGIVCAVVHCAQLSASNKFWELH